MTIEQTARSLEADPEEPGLAGHPLLNRLRADRAHPEVRALLRLIDIGSPANPGDYSVDDARRGLRFLVWAYGTREIVEEITDHTIPGDDEPVAIRIYKPSKTAESLPVFFWFHGGGFILGDLSVGDGTCRAIANRSGAAVIAVDYRKAPEYDLYAGRRDCLAAMDWVIEHGATLGLDASRIAVGGDSAGGNLAAVAAQTWAKKAKGKILLQVLAYPATDLSTNYRDMIDLPEGYLLTTDSIDWFRAKLGDFDRTDPFLSPVEAKQKDLKGVAPCFLITAGYDPLCHEGIAYAGKLRQAGVAVETAHYPGQIHGFLSLDAVLKDGQEALSRIGAALGQVFGTVGLKSASGPLSVRRQQPSPFRQIFLDSTFMYLMMTEFFMDRLLPPKRS